MEMHESIKGPGKMKGMKGRVSTGRKGNGGTWSEYVPLCLAFIHGCRGPYLKSPLVQPLVRNLKRQVQGAWENCGKSVHTNQPSLAPTAAHL